MTTVLLTSAGSLVGQNILEALAGRRKNLRVIGMNTDIDHDNLWECDLAIKSPATNSANFISEIQEICLKHNVELVIPCRDEDVLVLAHARDRENLPISLLAARSELIEAARDKWQSFLRFGETGINFCPTLCTDDVELATKLDHFVTEWGFPMISKPRVGNASQGVRVLLGRDHLNEAIQIPGRLIQPFLSPPKSERLNLDTRAGVPLFWEVPTENFKAVTILICKGGDRTEWYCTSSTLRLGRLEKMARDDDPSLHEYAKSCLTTLLALDWRGPIMLQVGKDRNGKWRAFEVNPRFSGGTSSRFLLGFDEVGTLINDWFGRDLVPKSEITPVAVVHRSLRPRPV